MPTPSTAPAAAPALDALGLTRSGLRFTDRSTEVAYRGWYLGKAVPFTRSGMVGGLPAWFLAMVILWFVYPENARAGIALVFLGAVLPICVTVALSYSPRLIHWMLPSTTVANGLAGLSLLALGSWLVQDRELTTAVLVIAAYFGFAIFRLHPPQAMLGVASFMVPNLLDLARRWVGGTVPTSRMILESAIIATVYATGTLISVVLERVSREAFRNERIITAQKEVIEFERARADRLLFSVFPVAIAERLKATPGVIADRFAGVTVIFADVVGFTPLAARITPEQLVGILDEIFTRFDALAEAHGVEKIKTIGDAYMAVAGVPTALADHAAAAARMALAMRETIEAYSLLNSYGIRLRIGLASGPAVAGVIGSRKFAYDLWGDTVNTAARMESHGVAGAIHVAESTQAELVGRFAFEDRGLVDVKGKGPMRTFLLLGPV